MRRLVALLLLAASSAFGAQTAPLPIEQCAVHTPFGLPTVKRQDVTQICREGYFTIHDNKAKVPLITMYVMKPEHASGCEARDNTFEVDRSLPPSARSGNKDYAKSGYDIGHIANAADLKYSHAAQVSAAILSNTAPQPPEFNRGVWKRLEDQTRGWVISRDTPVQVIAGSIINLKQDKKIGKGQVDVPSAFYKLLIDTKTHEAQVFIMKAEGSQAALNTFLSSLAEVQRQTGVVIPVPKDVKYSVGKTWPVTLKSARSVRGVCALK